MCVKIGIDKLTIGFLGSVGSEEKKLYAFKITCWHVDNHPQKYVPLKCRYENIWWTVDIRFLGVGGSEKKTYKQSWG